MVLFDRLKTFYTVQQAERLTLPEILTLQEKRFRKLLRYVLEKSPFYRHHYQEHGIFLRHAETIKLQDIPPINKRILMEHFDDLTNDPLLTKKDLSVYITDLSNRGKKYADKYYTFHTSGTTGNTGIFVYDQNGWDLLKALTALRVAPLKPNPIHKPKLAFICATSGNLAGITYAQELRKTFNTMYISIERPLHENIGALNLFQPEYIAGYTSGVYLLAREQLRGNLHIQPRMIVSTADVLTINTREVIKLAFGVETHNLYSASESLLMAVDCDLHLGVHQFCDWHIFEAVDRDFHPVVPGVPGHLILTNLYNYVQPLIRYEMNDQVIMNADPCPCGSPFPVIQSICGRDEELLWFEKPCGLHEYIHPSSIMELNAPGLERLQAVQTRKDELTLLMTVNGVSGVVTGEIKQKLQRLIRSKGLEHCVTCKIKVVDFIPNDPRSGKFYLAVPYREHGSDIIR